MASSVLRRSFLLSSTAVLAVAATASGLLRRAMATPVAPVVGVPGKVKIHQFTDMGKSIGIVEMDKVVKTDEAWQAQLASAPADSIGRATAFSVTRQEDTEYPRGGPNWDNHSA